MLPDTGPDIGLLVHIVSGLLRAGLGRHREALLEFGAAEYPGSQLEGWHSLASQVTDWMLAAWLRSRRSVLT